MQIPLVGPSNQESSLSFDAQRTINLYPVISESKTAKTKAALYPTPGLSLFATAGVGEIRGMFSSHNGRAFVVSYDSLYEISSAGAATFRGMLNSSDTLCSIDENPNQLAICDGTDLYIFTYATDAFARVTDTDFPDASTVTFLDGYFIVNKPSSGEFYISDLNDGLEWNALDFATAEGSPDNLVRVFGYNGLVLMGERTSEFWYNSGDVDFPFARIEGAKIDTGCAAAHTVLKLDNGLFFLGQDKDGAGIVYRMQGYQPVRISTHAVETALQASGDLSEIRAYSYQQDGHIFYVLTGGNLQTTWVYDCATKLWHERANLETNGTLTTHRATAHMYAFNKNLVGDKYSGAIYELSQSVYSDNGSEILRQRTFSHLFNDGKPFRMNQLIIEFERGIGLTSGQGSAPVAVLEISEDGGETWSSQYEASIGALGVRTPRTRWTKLGMAETGAQITFRVSVTDPVKVVMTGAHLT